MTRILGVLLVLCFFVVTIPVVSSELSTETGVHHVIIYVDDDNVEGPWDGSLEFPYQYIQDGIDNAPDYALVYVFNGTYYEQVTIPKPVILSGEHADTTIVDGQYQEYVVFITADHVCLTNMTIRNTGGYHNNAGIQIQANNISILSCILLRAKSGIRVTNASHTIIEESLFYSNGEGILLEDSQKITCSTCYFHHNAFGIHMLNSSSILLSECHAVTCGIGFYSDHIQDVVITRSGVYNNNDNQGGFYFLSSEKISVENCNVYHNGFGIRVINTTRLSMANSTVSWNTHYGVTIDEGSDDVILENNNIVNNLRFGIEVEGSRCQLSHNNIYANLFGLNVLVSFCDAQHNWWGSPLGPALLERRIKDRIYGKNAQIQFFPWPLRKYQFAGSDWTIDQELLDPEINTSRYEDIELPGEDTDHDNIPDWWEEKWNYNPETWDDHEHLDPDGDGLNNIEECYTDQWDSDPFQKDVFLEVDWVQAQDPEVTNKPPETYLIFMKAVFQLRGIHLHVDIGNLGGGEELVISQEFTYADLRDIYWDFFLHNDLNNPRKGIFHYCFVCDYGPGGGFAFFGWDHLDSFEIAAQRLQNRYDEYTRGQLIVGGTIHELGHTLSLTVDDHGGNDNAIALQPFTLQWWKYRNYKSCMNYRYTYQIIDFSDGTHGRGDFNDWDHLDFSFFKKTHFLNPHATS